MTMPAEDLTLYAKWSILRFEIKITDSNVTVYQNEFNLDEAIPNNLLPTPLGKTGHTFSGWRVVQSQPTCLKMILLLVQYTINRYTMSFETYGGSLISPITQDYNTVLTVTNPTKTGHTFDGFYSDTLLTNAYAMTSMPAEDLTLHAKWSINDYTMSFETNGGTLVSPITQAYDSVVIAPQPTKNGYTFKGYYSDVSLNNYYSITYMPPANLTLYAKWSINSYTLTFDTNGGSLINPITQDYNTVLTVSNPTRTGYTFDGFYKDASLTNSYTITNMPAEDLTLYAKWSINSYTLTFVTNGGSVINSITQDYNTVVTVSNPTRTGYTFDGFYTDALFTSAYVITNMPEQT